MIGTDFNVALTVRPTPIEPNNATPIANSLGADLTTALVIAIFISPSLFNKL